MEGSLITMEEPRTVESTTSKSKAGLEAGIDGGEEPAVIARMGVV